MTRNDFILTFILGLILLSGVTVESIRGANKTAKVFITHPIESPFRSDPHQNKQNPPIQNNSTSTKPLSLSDNRIDHANKKVLDYLNNASKEQLKQISGIGEAYAQRIIDARNKKAFTTENDVLNISGIGQAKWRSILDYVESDHTNNQIQTAPLPYRSPIINQPIFQSTQKPISLGKININQAQKEDLIKISGIGEVTATNLLKARHARGKFDHWDQVKEVSGIGEKRLVELQENFFIQ